MQYDIQSEELGRRRDVDLGHPGMNPMDSFDPDMPCRVHDGLNDQVIEWSPNWASMYRQYAWKWDEGVVAWDGLLLDGWSPIAPSCGH